MPNAATFCTLASMGFGCAMVWCGLNEQPLEDFEGATSMYAQPMQKGVPSMVAQQRTKPRELIIAMSGKKGTAKGQKSIDDTIVRNYLEGISRFIGKSGWVDPQGRKGKGYGVYRFANKYGTNIDGYSPIYAPDDWSDAGNTFSLGTKGLIAWAGLLVILLGVGINLVISTSQLG